MIDLQQVRADTPACESITHFNNAGAALSPSCVTDAQISHLRLEQEIGGYEAADKASESLAGFYSACARLLNCKATEIAYMENATKAWHAAFHAIDLQAGDHVITADMEYASNYMDLLHLAKQRQLQITTVASNAEGCVDPQAIASAIKSNTRLICLTHVPSQRGDIQPAQSVGEIAKAHKLWYLLDACQSAGQLQLDVEELGCDLLCGTGRKYLRGPRGTGFLYARESRLKELTPAVIDLHSAQWRAVEDYSLKPDASRFENWERNIAGMLGLTAAVNYALDIGMHNIQQRVQKLACDLHERLQSCENIDVWERSNNLSGIVTLSRTDLSADATHALLSSRGINSSISRQANAQLDLAKQQRDVNRISLHYYNSEDEIERFLKTVSE